MRISSYLEYFLRRFYFAYPSLVKAYQRHKIKRLSTSSRQVTLTPELLTQVLNANIPPHRDLIVHSSIAGLGSDIPAAEILKILKEITSVRGVNLLVPTHPKLKKGSDGIPVYDPDRSVSTVGLISELARRDPDFRRSRHPFSSVAVYGPNQDEYVRNNLNDKKPLPHGVYSPYWRLAERGGLALCLGVSFIKSLTMIHVAEEVMDQEFPRKLEFKDHQVRLNEAGQSQIWWVRRRSEAQLANLIMGQIRRDLVKRGYVQQLSLSGAICEVVDCRKVVDFMSHEAKKNGYPYLFLGKKTRSAQA